MKCTCDCSCDSCYDSDTLRAQLAAVEKERDEGVAALREQADAHRADILRIEAEYDADMAAAREKGRREGYGQANLEKAKRPSSEEDLIRLRALEAQWRQGYDACTADVVAWAKMEATSRAEATYECIAEDIERGEHVGAAGEGRL